MLGQFDLITYEEPPSVVARRTNEKMASAIGRGTMRLSTAMFPDKPSASQVKITFSDWYLWVARGGR